MSAPLRVVDASVALTEPRIDVEDPHYRPSWLEVRALQPDGRELKGVPFVVATEAPKGGLHVTGRSGERTALPPGEYRIEFSTHCGARRYFDRRKVRLDPGATASVDLTATRRIGRVRVSAEGAQPDRSRGLGVVVDGGREDRIVIPTESSFFAPCDGELVVTAKAVRRTTLDEPAEILTARVGRSDSSARARRGRNVKVFSGRRMGSSESVRGREDYDQTTTGQGREIPGLSGLTAVAQGARSAHAEIGEHPPGLELEGHHAPERVRDHEQARLAAPLDEARVDP